MGAVIDAGNLNRAHKRVKANRGAPGVDGMTVQSLRGWIAANREGLIASLLHGSYQPNLVRGVSIPKPGLAFRSAWLTPTKRRGGGECRPGIPTVVDRLVQQAITQVLEPILDPTFSGAP
jgi:RNA-directed DNA polymerase